MSKNLREFFYGSPQEIKPPSKIIENRTAWRIIICRLDSDAQPDRPRPHAPKTPLKDQAGAPGESEACAPERVKIDSTAAHDGRLILAPFAKRSLKCDILNQFEFERWEKRGFVRTYPEPEVNPPTDFANLLHGAAWFILIATLFTSPFFGAQFFFWPALLLSAGVVLYFDGLTIRKWASEVTSFLVIVLISLGLSLGFFFLFTRDPASPSRFLSSVSVQAGIAVVFFVVLTSSIPALLYYLFERQKSETTKEIFLRDTIRLNPNVYTLDEAEFRYGTLADEVYGHKPSQDFLGGLQVSLLVNLALTTLGWSLALMPNVGNLPPDIRPYEAVPLLLTPLRHPIVFGALGSYFFALNMLFRRYVRADLTAKAYTHVVMRQLITVTLVWVVSVPTQLWANLGGFGQDALLVFSFLVGIVPETALAVVQDYLRNTKVLTTRIPSLEEDQPLDDLQGVTLYDRARLLEEGIENVENLAHHNLIELMLRAHMPTPRLADLVDQAILYLHLYEPPPADRAPAEKQAVGNATVAAAANAVPEDKLAAGLPVTNLAPANTARNILLRFGIRTATDLEHARDLAASRGEADLRRLLSLLDGDGHTPGRLQVVLDALQDDDWMSYLREWHRNQRSSLALTLEEIEDILIGLPIAKDNQNPPVADAAGAPPKSPDLVTGVSVAAPPAARVGVATPAAETTGMPASAISPPGSSPAAIPLPKVGVSVPVPSEQASTVKP